MINTIDPAKDVDGFHISNVGLLGTGQKSMVPCTPLGCLMMLRDHHGQPVGPERGGAWAGRTSSASRCSTCCCKDSCTVTVAHSRTKDIEEVCRGADILVAAVGRPEMVTGDWIKPGATVIDVGINRIPAPEKGEGKTRIVGDCDYDSCAERGGGDHAGAGGRGADDHRLPARQHADRLLPRQRPGGAGRADRLILSGR